MGKKIVIELTNRCNLHCQHCFSGRHGGKDDLPLPILQQILTGAKDFGFTELSFTGGDPTVYRHFAEALALTCTAGYRFAINTNGWNFVQIYPILLPYRQQLTILTFSLDGASEATHDRLRGRGSFRRVMQAMSICVVKELPFSLNMVITAHNRHELATLVAVAPKLGSRGVRFGHLLPTPSTVAQGLDLSLAERRTVEDEITGLAQQAPLPVVMAPGTYTTELFPCAPLHLQEININCYGELTKCCHLSGHGAGVEQSDVIANLTQVSFGEAYARLVAENALYHQRKIETAHAATWQENDFFPCWYCSRYYGKNAWRQAKGTRIHVIDQYETHTTR